MAAPSFCDLARGTCESFGDWAPKINAFGVKLVNKCSGSKCGDATLTFKGNQKSGLDAKGALCNNADAFVELKCAKFSVDAKTESKKDGKRVVNLKATQLFPGFTAGLRYTSAGRKNLQDLVQLNGEYKQSAFALSVNADVPTLGDDNVHIAGTTNAVGNGVVLGAHTLLQIGGSKLAKFFGIWGQYKTGDIEVNLRYGPDRVDKENEVFCAANVLGAIGKNSVGAELKHKLFGDNDTVFTFMGSHPVSADTSFKGKVDSTATLQTCLKTKLAAGVTGQLTGEFDLVSGKAPAFGFGVNYE
jgi:hypothetical protein